MGSSYTKKNQNCSKSTQKEQPRFRLIRLEERIAPAKVKGPGTFTNNPAHCDNTRKYCWGW